MKTPWRNPLKPLLGCAALIAAASTFVYAIGYHPKYYQSNHASPEKDCMFTNDDYAFTNVYCGDQHDHTASICNYYLPSREQVDCSPLSSSTLVVCREGDLELIHVCYL